MTERVNPLDLDIHWDPIIPSATLMVEDMGRTSLALNPHPDDLDRRRVVLIWSSTSSAAMSAPNDEALAGHRLWGKGLKDVVWLGEVTGSEYIAELEAMNRVHPLHVPSRFAQLRHFVFPLKECTVEVVAEAIPVVERWER